MNKNTLLLFLAISISGHAQWKSLFNGKDLSGFVQRNGKAQYKVLDNTIVGISTMNTPNSFLCTDQDYSNFVLELDVKVEAGLNSGIQIRSISDPAYNNGKVHGYQVEIDPGKRSWAGGIFDEGRSGWKYPLSVNPKGQEAFMVGQWNTYHIEAVGQNIKTWINGIPCANLFDPQTASGFIALQVHAIKTEKQQGLTVQWRNIRIATDNLDEVRFKEEEAPEISYLVNQLTENEIRKGWRLLWDGKTSDGWKIANGKEFPEKGWIMDNGVLSVLGLRENDKKVGGDIETLDEFGNFELELECMLTEGANSGIKYFVVNDPKKGKGSGLGPEFQLLDDNKHPDAKAGVAGNRTTASLYDLITSENLSEGGGGKRIQGPGKWNKVRVVSKDGHVEHWINNLKMVEYNRNSQIFRNLVAKSKFSPHLDFAQAAKGHILLQDHGDVVHFRSIKIREF
jgi:hypothetical protein